jgi:hypothetical protein
MIRYLQLIRPDHSWIERPDLYLLARMSYEDKHDDSVVHQLYEAMCRGRNTFEDLNVFEADLEKRQLRRQLRHRLFAGSTVLELIRIAADTGKPPTATQAMQLVAFNQKREEKTGTSLESVLRDVRRGFSAYRNTAHLQATMIMANPSVSAIELSETHFLEFLARARGLEHFLDTNVFTRQQKWNPWRVPTRVNPIWDIVTKRLSAEERAAAGVK